MLKMNLATEVVDYTYGTEYLYRDGSRALYLVAPLDNEVVRAIVSRKISRLVIRQYVAWRKTNVEELRGSIDSVWIEDAVTPRALILQFPWISSVHLPFAADGIDFSKFGALEECVLSNQRRIPRSLQKCRKMVRLSLSSSKLAELELEDLCGLKELGLSSVSVRSLANVGRLTNLRHLGISRSRESDLSFLRGCKRLEYCSLSVMPKLETLAGIEDCCQLHHFDLASCGGVSDLKPLGMIPSLRELVFESCPNLLSLLSLLALNDLEKLLLWETTKIADGNLSQLLSLPRLREFSFKDRSNYNVTAKEVQRELSLRR